MIVSAIAALLVIRMMIKHIENTIKSDESMLLELDMLFLQRMKTIKFHYLKNSLGRRFDSKEVWAGRFAVRPILAENIARNLNLKKTGGGF
jgi:hypothetical protein